MYRFYEEKYLSEWKKFCAIALKFFSVQLAVKSDTNKLKWVVVLSNGSIDNGRIRVVRHFAKYCAKDHFLDAVNWTRFLPLYFRMDWRSRERNIYLLPRMSWKCSCTIFEKSVSVFGGICPILIYETTDIISRPGNFFKNYLKINLVSGIWSRTEWIAEKTRPPDGERVEFKIAEEYCFSFRSRNYHIPWNETEENFVSLVVTVECAFVVLNDLIVCYFCGGQIFLTAIFF